MTGRVLWWLALAMAGAMALVAEVDRASRFSPELAPLVPAGFPGFAAEQRAKAAIAAGDGEAALAEAHALVRARPLPAEHLSLLAYAAAMEGDEALSLAALELSTTRGWREPLAQQAAAEAALLSGEHDVAAGRIAALFATGALPDETAGLAARLLESEAGRQAFARRLAAAGHWQSNALPAFSAAADPGQLTQTVTLAASLGARLPCERLQAIAATYEASGRGAAAGLLRGVPCR